MTTVVEITRNMTPE